MSCVDHWRAAFARGETVEIACCPEHGLHGVRATCFDCGGPVAMIPMRALATAASEQVHETHSEVTFTADPASGDVVERAHAVAEAWARRDLPLDWLIRGLAALPGLDNIHAEVLR